MTRLLARASFRSRATVWLCRWRSAHRVDKPDTRTSHTEVRRQQGQTRRAERHHHSHWRSRALARSVISVATRYIRAGDGRQVRLRPEPGTWSAIEYAAHSRDVTLLHAYGVREALTGNEPTFPRMSDEQVDAAVSAYDRADPNAVVDALAEPAERLAQVAEDAGFDVWSREIIVGATRSDVRRLLEHALHDSLHHPPRRRPRTGCAAQQRIVDPVRILYWPHALLTHAARLS
jgi:hypothetical protein